MRFRRRWFTVGVTIFVWCAVGDPWTVHWKLTPWSAPVQFLVFMLWAFGEFKREQICEITKRIRPKAAEIGFLAGQMMRAVGL